MFRPADYGRLSKVSVPCACCGSLSYAPAFRGDRYNFGLQTVVCTMCGLVFTNPRPREEWFREFYRLHYRDYYEQISVPDEDYLKRDWIAGRHQRNVELLSPSIAESGSLLDIGCAEGTFLHLFRKRYPLWQISGIEPSESFSAFARSYYGLDRVRTCMIEDLARGPSGALDLVTASHVLEHLLDPNVFFVTARHLLRDRGLLFIDVPDAEGERKGIRNVHIGHVYHYSKRSLRNFLARSGFEVLFCRKGSEKRKPWTLQILACKQAHLPTEWLPLPVDGAQVARSFRRHSRLTVNDRVRRLKRRVSSGVGWICAASWWEGAPK